MGRSAELGKTNVHSLDENPFVFGVFLQCIQSLQWGCPDIPDLGNSWFSGNADRAAVYCLAVKYEQIHVKHRVLDQWDIHVPLQVFIEDALRVYNNARADTTFREFFKDKLEQCVQAATFPLPSPNTEENLSSFSKVMTHTISSNSEMNTDVTEALLRGLLLDSVPAQETSSGNDDRKGDKDRCTDVREETKEEGWEDEPDYSDQPQFANKVPYDEVKDISGANWVATGRQSFYNESQEPEKNNSDCGYQSGRRPPTPDDRVAKAIPQNKFNQDWSAEGKSTSEITATAVRDSNKEDCSLSFQAGDVIHSVVS